MASDKRQGWCIYEKVSFAVLDPNQLQYACGMCNSTDLAWIKNTETDERAYVCRSCEHGEIVEGEEN